MQARAHTCPSLMATGVSITVSAPRGLSGNVSGRQVGKLFSFKLEQMFSLDSWKTQEINPITAHKIHSTSPFLTYFLFSVFSKRRKATLNNDSCRGLLLF